MTRRVKTAEDGFTLIELLVTIAILGIIMVPLCNFVIAYFQDTAAVQGRVAVGHDIQFAAAYLSRDVNSAGLYTVSGSESGTTFTPQSSLAVTPGGATCGSKAGTVLLRVQWDDWTVSSNQGTGVVDTASWVIESGTLHRVYCPSTSMTPSTTVSSDILVVNNLDGTPSVTCQATASSPASQGACAASPPPDIVTITLTIDAPGNSAPTTQSLNGTRRQS